jgi:hypothetical protein
VPGGGDPLHPAVVVEDHLPAGSLFEIMVGDAQGAQVAYPSLMCRPLPERPNQGLRVVGAFALLAELAA